MTKQGKEFGVCLFGYNRQEVSDDISKFKRLNREKLDAIKQRVDAIRLENENLSKEIAKLKEELSSNAQPEEFMTFALKKFEEWMPVVNEIAKNEAADIGAEMSHQEELFDQKTSEFTKEIKHTQEELDMLLKNILKQTENLSENVMSFIHKNDVQYNGNESKDGITEQNDIISPSDFCPDYVDKNTNIEELQNNGIEKDISQIRSKYLVGKVAGEDLYDKNNNLIIAKNGVITEEIIRKSIQKEKLAELIINMTVTSNLY